MLSLHHSTFLCEALLNEQCKQSKSHKHILDLGSLDLKYKTSQEWKPQKGLWLCSHVKSNFCIKSEDPSGFQKIQYLWQLTQIPCIDVSTDTPIGVFYVGSHEMKSICRCQERKEFVLLGLIIQDLGFWFPRAKHLRVSSSLPATGILKSYSTLSSFSTWTVKDAFISNQNIQEHTTVSGRGRAVWQSITEDYSFSNVKLL